MCDKVLSQSEIKLRLGEESSLLNVSWEFVVSCGSVQVNFSLLWRDQSSKEDVVCPSLAAASSQLPQAAGEEDTDPRQEQARKRQGVDVEAETETMALTRPVGGEAAESVTK